jgi:hypothetical protein
MADNLTKFNVPTVLKTGSLNLLEPSMPAQACNWIALLTETLIFQTVSPWRRRRGI